MSNGQDSVDKSESADKRYLQIYAILQDCLRRRAEGESIPDTAIVAANLELMPELGDELRKLRLIAAAREKAFGPPESDVEQTVEHKPSRKDSRGLHIRCPHCSNFVEVIADTPYEEISCGSCGSSFSLVDREESTRMAAPLKSIGRFDLVTRLGVGGFGTVWKARDRELDRTVAVKIPRRGQLAPAEIDQFFREARAAAQLSHPHIVPVHEVGRDGETLFIVSDLIRGATLTDWLTGNPLSTREKVELCEPIADALHHAHQQGVIHRDLKPSNILVDEGGVPHLSDFGLAKREVGEVTMTVDGQVLGTPAYMSPEQASGLGHWTDRRTDIYSFGVVLFQLLTGELPFRGNAQMQILQRRTDDAPDPRKLNRHIPRDLATVCLKCLEREPGRRYSTAGELKDELTRFLRGEPIQARPISAPARLARWAGRKPWVAATAALIIFLAIAGPLAAVRIYLQGQQLEVRLEERNEFLARAKKEIDQSKKSIEDLGNQLSVWNGQSNPTEFWPVKRDAPPRQTLVADLFDHTHDKLSGQLHGDNVAPAAKARGFIALAAMADAIGNPILAQENYQLVRTVLVSLQDMSANQPGYARALARCNARLADLTAANDRERAAKDSDAARSIYQRLASGTKPDALAQIEWLESELKAAQLLGYDAGKQHLIRVGEIKNVLINNWPSDPDGLYRTVCFLTHEEPVLLSSVDVANSQPAAAGVTPTNR